MIEELAKALALSTKTVDTAIELFSNVFGTPTQITGEALSDTLRNWQWKNRIKIASRASELTGDQCPPVSLMPKGFFLRFIDYSGNVEDNELQEIWARLLADSTVTHSQFHPLLLSALQGLDPDDARLFDCVMKHAYRETSKQNDDSVKDTRYGFALDPELEVSSGLTRLEILNLVRPCPNCLRMGSHIYVSTSSPRPHGDLTVLGAELGRVLGFQTLPIKNKGYSTY